MRKITLAAVAILAATSMASAAVLTVSSAAGAPNSGNLTVTVSVAGGEQADVLNLLLVIGNGGPTYGGTDQVGTPAFAGGAIANPGIAASSNAGNQYFQDVGNGPEKWLAGNVIVNPTAMYTLNGNVATFQISTAGAVAGVYPIFFDTTGNTSITSAGTPVAVEFANGTITITPEPATMILLGLGGLFLRRRHA